METTETIETAAPVKRDLLVPGINKVPVRLTVAKPTAKRMIEVRRLSRELGYLTEEYNMLSEGSAEVSKQVAIARTSLEKKDLKEALAHRAEFDKRLAENDRMQFNLTIERAKVSVENDPEGIDWENSPISTLNEAVHFFLTGSES